MVLQGILARRLHVHIAAIHKLLYMYVQGIPRSMSRAQAKSVLTLLGNAVADLPDHSWNPDDWKGMASIVESFAEVPRSLEVPCSRMHSEIARRLVEQQPTLSGQVLSQLVAAFAAGSCADQNAVAALFSSITGRYDQQGACTIADVAESLSMAGDIWAHEVNNMVSWALEVQDITNEVCLCMVHFVSEFVVAPDNC